MHGKTVWACSMTSLAVICTTLSAAEFRAADPLPPASRWIPAEAVFVVEVSRPGALLDLAFEPTLVEAITSLPAYQEQAAQPGFQQFRQVVRFLEISLDTPWPAGVRKLVGGGVTLAVSADGGALLIVDAKDAQMLQRLHEILLGFAKNQAEKQEQPGRFAPLLEAVSRDPAVLLGLDAAANRKAQPNEQPARTIIEVYSLGPGHASEADLRSAARAFTGWFVLRGRLRYIEREHDTGTKRFLGEEGDLDADDVVRILLKQPAVSRLLVRKLYRRLIRETEEPGDALLAPLVESFRKDYDVASLVETMLRSNLFFSPAAYRRRIKSPVEFALGIVRDLEGMVSTTQLGQDLAALGQNLYHPPTVRGWRGGRYWINRATLIGRGNLAAALLLGSEPYGEKLDPAAIAGKHGFAEFQPAARFLLKLFLQGDIEADVGESLLKDAAANGGDLSHRLRRLARAIATLPEFHLA